MMNGRADLERARSALFALEADCPRDQWVRISMAAKAAGIDQETLREWSQQASNYREMDFDAMWRSIKPEGGIGEASLFRMAIDAGWSDRPTHIIGVNGARASQFGLGREYPSKFPREIASKFASYPPATPNHPYIAAKRGVPDGLRVVPADDPVSVCGTRVAGWLAVPVRSLDGELQSIQYIPPPGTGKKLNAKGASFGDGMFIVGGLTSDGTAYVVEGLGQAWACTRADYHAAAVAAFGSGRLEKVAKLLRERYPMARMLLVADRGKENECERIVRKVGGGWIELPSDLPANFDVNDYEGEYGIDALAEVLHKVKTPPLRYRLQPAVELLNAPPMCWMVHGVVPLNSFNAMFGPSGCGKSFLVLDMAVAIASGKEWFGRRVTVAPVIYVALEGAAGLGKRIRALAAHHERDLPERLRFITQPLDLRQLADIDDLCASVLSTRSDSGILVIDTLNRAAPGADENSSKDMGALIGACEELQRRTGWSVLLVHHTGKDGTKGLRGHSSLFAALDSAIEVSRTGDRHDWSVSKSKDGADGERHGFILRQVSVGSGDDGEAVTSCVVEVADAPEKSRAKRIGEVEGAVAEFLAARKTGIRKRDVVSHFEGRYDKGPVYRAMKALVAAGAVHEAAGMVCIATAVK